MRGKFWLITSIFFFVVALAYSQGLGGSSIGFTTGGSGVCDVPSAGHTYLCGSSTDVQISVNGSPYATVKGATGPAGAPGVGTQGIKGDKGDQGIQGVPGPATLPKACTMKITGVNPDGSWSVAFSNCS